MSPPPLRGLRIASPCSADWAAMPGTDRVRACADCGLNVYNLTALSTREARALVRDTEGRLCVRFYRRADGTVLTRDCPEGIPNVAVERRRGATAALALAALFAGSVGLTQAAWSLLGSVGSQPSIRSGVMGMMGPPADEWLMGDIAPPYGVEMGEPVEIPLDLEGPLPYPAAPPFPPPPPLF